MVFGKALLSCLLVLFCLGYRLWRCSSLWNMLSWMPETPPLFLYLQCQYFRFNKHVRCGLISGMIFLMMEFLFPHTVLRHKGVWICDWLGHFWMTVHWPIVMLLDKLNYFNWPKQDQAVLIIMSFMIYCTAIGFVVGMTVSFLKKRHVNPVNPVNPV